MLSAKERKLLEALEPLAASRNVEIVTVEVVGSRKAPTIRVYLDCDGGIGFDELAASQKWVNELMDELDPFPGAYTLEVSSGNRPSPSYPRAFSALCWRKGAAYSYRAASGQGKVDWQTLWCARRRRYRRS